MIICLLVSVFFNIMLFAVMAIQETEFLGHTSSLKLTIQRKEQEISNLKKVIHQLKLNTDVEV